MYSFDFIYKLPAFFELLTFNLNSGYFSSQVPEIYGPIRTIAEGKGEMIIIGTTKNYVLQGSLDGEFIPITQVQKLVLFLFTNGFTLFRK